MTPAKLLLLLVVPAWSTTPVVWQLQLPAQDQRALGVCLHLYLERDFPEIERIVYPAPTRSSADAKRRILADGPSLEASCVHLQRMARCFARVLVRMRYYEDFRELRRLVTAMDAVLLELCGAVDLMRHRFLPLLQTLSCLERVRQTVPCGEQLPTNVWHQLVRLEADTALCGPMSRQLHCVRDSGQVRLECGDTADKLFSNLSSVFLSHWCAMAWSAAPAPPGPGPLLPLHGLLLPLLWLVSVLRAP